MEFSTTVKLAFMAICGLAQCADAAPKMVAHRGAGDLTMPEASLPAYSNAVAAACDIVKLDLQHTKDGVVVMGHDNTLKRNMGWNVAISDVTYQEIYEKGRFLENKAPGKERIVRLDQALAIVKSAPEFWLDFKAKFSPELGEKVLAALATAGIDESRVMIATFNRPALKYFQTHHPAIRRVGHYSFKRDKDGDADNAKAMRKVLAYRDEFGLFGVNMPVLAKQTRPEDVAFLKKNGLWVSLWFIQNADSAKLYGPAGADAFVTDHVSPVREALRGQ